MKRAKVLFKLVLLTLFLIPIIASISASELLLQIRLRPSLCDGIFSASAPLHLASPSGLISM